MINIAPVNLSNIKVKGIIICTFWTILIFGMLIWSSIELGIHNHRYYSKKSCDLIKKTIDNDQIKWIVNVSITKNKPKFYQISKKGLSENKLNVLYDKYDINQTYPCYYYNYKIRWDSYKAEQSRNLLLIFITLTLSGLCLLSCATLILLFYKSHLKKTNEINDIEKNDVKKKDGENYEGFEDEI